MSIPAPAGLPRLQNAKVSPGKQYDTLEALLDNEELDLLMVGSPNTCISTTSASGSIAA